MNQIIKTILIILLVLLGFFFVNKFASDKQGNTQRLVSTDTTRFITKIDSLEKVIKGYTSIQNPTEAVQSTNYSILTKYITKTKECNRAHINELGMDLIKLRTYSDSRNIDGINVSYNAWVTGKLDRIDLIIDGKYYERRINTVETINNKYIKQTNQIYLFASYNRSLSVGAMFQNDRFHYGINYDLMNGSIGGQIGYTIINL